MRPLLILYASLFVACAAARPLPPGDELEDERSAEGGVTVVAGGTIPAPSQATGDELAAAFDEPEKASRAAPSREASESAPVSKEDLVAEDRAHQANAALAEARSALKAKDPDAAVIALGRAEDLDEYLDPRDAQQVAEMAYKVAVLREDANNARKLADKWLLKCGPDRVEACRSAALSAYLSASRIGGGKGEKAKERVAQIREYDACLRQAEAARGANGSTCLDGAIAAYRRMGDRLMLSRALFARALKLTAEPAKTDEALARVGQAESSCEEKRCAAVKRRALRTLSQLHLRKDEVRAAAAAILREMDLASASLPPAQRVYARTAEVERICLKLDSTQGDGACRKLEHQLTGHYTFKDFSRARSAGLGLSAAQVKEVNDHFEVSLRPCLEAEASTLRPPAMVTYRVEWLVTNEGRVEKVHLERKDKDEGPFGECLRERFRVWRYPQYQGEWQHVEQAFNLQARERRSER